MTIRRRLAKAAEAVLAAPQSTGLLEAADREKLVRRIEKARHAFADALSVVREHGQRTALGQKIMDDAEAGLA